MRQWSENGTHEIKVMEVCTTVKQMVLDVSMGVSG